MNPNAYVQNLTNPDLLYEYACGGEDVGADLKPWCTHPFVNSGWFADGNKEAW